MASGLDQEAVRGTLSRRFHRDVEYPGVNGKIQGDGISVSYEVMQVSNGNALVWMERIPPMPQNTASGGFGWIEPAIRNSHGATDAGQLRTRIERRLLTHLNQNRTVRSRS